MLTNNSILKVLASVEHDYTNLGLFYKPQKHLNKTHIMEAFLHVYKVKNGFTRGLFYLFSIKIFID
jgi:hypothetical protein